MQFWNFSIGFAISQPVELELVLACVGDVNTVMRGNIPWPILYGFGTASFVLKYHSVSFG